MKKHILPAILMLGLFWIPVLAQQLEPGFPPDDERCPVCGMFVAKYPDWLAQVQYSDGTIYYFDGAKDMFKFLAQPESYVQARPAKSPVAIFVREYYDLQDIPARDAWYVLGSDVLGPMGHEPIPLATREDAEAFLDDHRGSAIRRFSDMTPELMQQLDRGQVSSF